MSLSVVSRCVVVLTMVGVSACIRDLPDLPAPPEGGLITGRVLVRDRATTDLVGLRGASVGIAGTSIYDTTDERGFFQLTRTPLGALGVTVTRPFVRGQSRAGRRLDAVSILSSGQSTNLGDIELFGAGDIAGSVRVDSDTTAGGGALIVAAQTGFKSIVGLDRAFVLPSMPEGAFDVVAFLPGYTPATHGAVRVTANADVRLRELVFAGPGTAEVMVAGTIALADDGDVTTASVRFDAEAVVEASFTASVDAEGNFSLAVPAGPYRAHFSAPGYREVQIAGVAATGAGAFGLVPIHLSRESPGDYDDDGVTDEADDDIDNDGCANADDLFPRNAYACGDEDGDGRDDDLDLDDDDDTLLDAEELSAGVDDWITNPLAADTDGDGVDDAADNCPTFANADQADANGDGRGDTCATATATTPGTPPPPPTDRAIVAFPSLVMPGDVVRFTGADAAGATAIRVGTLALDAVTATTGGVLATVPAGIVPGVARLTTPRGEVEGPRLSTLEIRPIAGVECPRGESIVSVQTSAAELTLICTTQARTYDATTHMQIRQEATNLTSTQSGVSAVDAVKVRSNFVGLAVSNSTKEAWFAFGSLDAFDRECGVDNIDGIEPFNLNFHILPGTDVTTMMVRSPISGIWRVPGICSTVFFDYVPGSPIAISDAGDRLLLKHPRYGFALFRLGDSISNYDGQAGSADRLVANDDGSVWALGGSDGVTKYFPFTNRAPLRVPNLQTAQGARFLLDPSRRWLVTTRSGTTYSTSPRPTSVVFVDLDSQRVARRGPDGATVARSLTDVGPLIGYQPRLNAGVMQMSIER